MQAAGEGGVAAAEYLVWVLDQQATVQLAAAVADDTNDPELHHLVQAAETWIRYFAILRWVSQQGYCAPANFTAVGLSHQSV